MAKSGAVLPAAALVACLKCRSRGSPRSVGAPPSGLRRRQIDSRSRIGSAPTAVAPWQIPVRVGRWRGWDEIEPGGPERVTSAEAGQRHPAARPQAEAADCLLGIGRAGREMAAIEADQRGERIAIGRDQPASGEPRRPGNMAQQESPGSKSYRQKRAHRGSIFEEQAVVTECKFMETAIANGHAAAKLSDRGRFFGLDPNPRRL